MENSVEKADAITRPLKNQGSNRMKEKTPGKAWFSATIKEKRWQLG